MFLLERMFDVSLTSPDLCALAFIYYLRLDYQIQIGLTKNIEVLSCCTGIYTIILMNFFEKINVKSIY